MYLIPRKEILVVIDLSQRSAHRCLIESGEPLDRISKLKCKIAIITSGIQDVIAVGLRAKVDMRRQLF